MTTIILLETLAYLRGALKPALF